MSPQTTTRREYRRLDEFLRFVSSQGIVPNTVVDVGAAWGTQELLSEFPCAHHILIEPIPCFETRLRALLTKYKGEYHAVALSDMPGRLRMRVVAGGEDGSTLSSQTGADTIEVNVDTLDRLFSAHRLERPILIKTDCQGYDMHVMRGGAQLLADVDIAVCEVNMFHPAGRPELPDFGDSVTIMKGLGFSVYDILSYQTRPFDMALGYVDLAFVKENGPLRRHHRWS